MTVSREWITPLVATAALALGVVNFYFNVSKTRVKLRVKPSFSYFYTSGVYSMEDSQSAETITIEITNLSEFELAITEVGFKRWAKSRHRNVVTPSFSTTKGQMNRIDLRPRDNISVMCPTDVFSLFKTSRIRTTHVKTACGVEVVGTTRSFKRFCRSRYKVKE